MDSDDSDPEFTALLNNLIQNRDPGYDSDSDISVSMDWCTLQSWLILISCLTDDDNAHIPDPPHAPDDRGDRPTANARHAANAPPVWSQQYARSRNIREFDGFSGPQLPQVNSLTPFDISSLSN